MTKNLVNIPSCVSLFCIFLKFNVWVLLIAILSFACQSERQKAKDILSQQKMSSILTELHLAEAYILESRYRNDDTARLAYIKLEKEIFKKYDTDSLTYAKSYRYYAQSIAELNKIYNAVVDTLSYRESVAKAKKDKKDSLKKNKPKFIKGKDNLNEGKSSKSKLLGGDSKASKTANPNTQK